MDGSDQLVACVGHRPECSPPRRLDEWGRRVVRVWSSYDVTVGVGFRILGRVLRRQWLGRHSGPRAVERSSVWRCRGEILLRSRATVYSRSTFQRHARSVESSLRHVADEESLMTPQRSLRRGRHTDENTMESS